MRALVSGASAHRRGRLAGGPLAALRRGAGRGGSVDGGSMSLTSVATRRGSGSERQTAGPRPGRRGQSVRTTGSPGVTASRLSRPALTGRASAGPRRDPIDTLVAARDLPRAERPLAGREPMRPGLVIGGITRPARRSRSSRTGPSEPWHPPSPAARSPRSAVLARLGRPIAVLVDPAGRVVRARAPGTPRRRWRNVYVPPRAVAGRAGSEHCSWPPSPRRHLRAVPRSASADSRRRRRLEVRRSRCRAPRGRNVCRRSVVSRGVLVRGSTSHRPATTSRVAAGAGSSPSGAGLAPRSRLGRAIPVAEGGGASPEIVTVSRQLRRSPGERVRRSARPTLAGDRRPRAGRAVTIVAAAPGVAGRAPTRVAVTWPRDLGDAHRRSTSVQRPAVAQDRRRRSPTVRRRPAPARLAASTTAPTVPCASPTSQRAATMPAPSGRSPGQLVGAPGRVRVDDRGRSRRSRGSWRSRVSGLDGHDPVRRRPGPRPDDAAVLGRLGLRRVRDHELVEVDRAGERRELLARSRRGRRAASAGGTSRSRRRARCGPRRW